MNVCENCGKPCQRVDGVEVVRATRLSPAEHEMVGECCLRDAEQDEEMQSLRGLSDEELERV